MYAQDRFFAINELLELILLHSDAFTLLTSLSISHHWRTLLLTSPTLRHHLSTLQPPRCLPNSPATTGASSGYYRLYASIDYPWCLRTPTGQGTLWILRIPRIGLETLLLIPHSPRQPMRHLGASTHRKALLADRRAWRYAPDSHRPKRGKAFIFGPQISSLTFAPLSTTIPTSTIRADTKHLPRRGNVFREYLAVFYAEEFHALTGEWLKRGARDKVEEERVNPWPWGRCEECCGRMGEECACEEVVGLAVMERKQLYVLGPGVGIWL